MTDPPPVHKDARLWSSGHPDSLGLDAENLSAVTLRERDYARRRRLVMQLLLRGALFSRHPMQNIKHIAE